MIISIGAGHGAAPMIIIQYMTIFNKSSQMWLLPAILFSFSQIAFIIALFRIKLTLRKFFLVGGILIATAGIASLILIGQEDYNSAMPTYVTAIPFLCLTFIAFFRVF